MKSNQKLKNKEIKTTDSSKIPEMCKETTGNRNKHNISRNLLFIVPKR